MLTNTSRLVLCLQSIRIIWKPMECAWQIARLVAFLLQLHCCCGGVVLNLDSLSRPEAGRAFWQELAGPALLQGPLAQPGHGASRAGEVRVGSLGNLL